MVTKKITSHHHRDVDLVIVVAGFCMMDGRLDVAVLQSTGTVPAIAMLENAFLLFLI